MRSFRLISASTASVLPSRKSKSSAPSVTVDFTPSEWRERDNAISVIIGSNGTGKSRLLGAIADSFLQLGRTQSRAYRGFPVRQLTYQVDGHVVRSIIRTTSSGQSSFERDLNNELLLPTKIIAVAMTPFDKFPLAPSTKKDTPSIPYYHYVGMRDRTNRASFTALLYRAIEGLLQRRDQNSRTRLSEVFELLGYKPRVAVSIKLQMSYEDLRLYTPIANNIRGANPPSPQSIFHDDVAYALKALLGERPDDTRDIRIDIDLSDQSEVGPIEYASLALLRRAGLIRLKSVEVTRIGGLVIDLKNASSGEISIFTTFLSIASALEDGSLVLIDEPETSLHPEWQAKIIKLIVESFSRFRGCHFLLSTHSPIIASDMPPSASIFSLDRKHSLSAKNVSGKSTDYLLATAFEAPTANNYFINEEIVSALRMAADGKVRTQEFVQTVDQLEEISKNLDDRSATFEVIRELISTRNRLSHDDQEAS